MRPQLSLAVPVAFLLLSEPASAFCRTTSCLSDPEAVCTWDDNGCIFEGIPLGWPLGTTVKIRLDASELTDDEATELTASLERAADAWSSVRCDGASSLGLGGYGGAGGTSSGSESETATGGAQADLKIQVTTHKAQVVVRPVTRDWSYPSSVAAKTTLNFGLDSGTLEDVVLELNFQDFRFVSEVQEEGEVASDAVLTHELGHVLGLDHTPVQGATMEAEVTSAYSSALATLEPDDGDALCSIYPPKPEDDPTPIDLSDDVELPRSQTCSLALTPAQGDLGALGPFILAAGLATLRRRASLRRRRRGVATVAGVGRGRVL